MFIQLTIYYKMFNEIFSNYIIHTQTKIDFDDVCSSKI